MLMIRLLGRSSSRASSAAAAAIMMTTNSMPCAGDLVSRPLPSAALLRAAVAPVGHSGRSVTTLASLTAMPGSAQYYAACPLAEPATHNSTLLLVPSVTELDPSAVSTLQMAAAPAGDSAVLAAARGLFEGIHDMTGLPWWLSIVASAFLLRTVFTLPLSVYATKESARMVLAEPQLKAEINAKQHEVAAECRRNNLTYEQFQKRVQPVLRETQERFMTKIGYSPMRSVALAWAQAPLFIAITLALRGMSGWPISLRQYFSFLMPSETRIKQDFLNELVANGVAKDLLDAEHIYSMATVGSLDAVPELPFVSPGLTSEGILSFTDLTAPDQFYLVPVLIGGIMLYNTQLTISASSNKSLAFRIGSQIWRLLAIAMGFAAAVSPASVGMYWLGSAIYSALQNISFRIPAVRRLLGIPVLPVTAQNSRLPFPLHKLDLGNGVASENVSAGATALSAAEILLQKKPSTSISASTFGNHKTGGQSWSPLRAKK
ncbi:hypothetical protein CAOG_08696 [Capsaspora owczarzaki ATCC 30864]|uniref:Membrane insertase YidC/Oxa/ALB C-terminal domain-containing protein n=1 Tax=Capsaspora owczarzaki (strain ATCC 30864) TaxID=595528 RepID=A0A0D2VPH6_CAPO3|nr:hypothetical protein CAOG_08696 [Capsaspora owczarzaki ATCC 30864]KJE92387.1 hypothetical protein CAOG_008696 [Capsaspora owczarzaki ATCC 30864]|eukprot:XP_011270307.1 hypothetical protein CAOG_08696 [Capsaspora owczarzaki ATCC 30864]